MATTQVERTESSDDTESSNDPEAGNADSQAAEAPEDDTRHSTFQRLDDIIAKFDSFDVDMRIGTKQRRENDMERVMDLKAHMCELETRLLAKTAKRTETNAAARAWWSTAIGETQRRCFKRLECKRAEIEKRVDALRAKIAAMRAKFANDFRDVPIDIEQRGYELADRLKQSMDEFEVESAARLKREAAVLKRLSNHESAVAKRFRAERTLRERAQGDFVSTLETHIEHKERQTELLNTFMFEQSAKINNAITVEAKTRWREDTELAHAMNAYISKLQLSLRVVNSNAV